MDWQGLLPEGENKIQFSENDPATRRKKKKEGGEIYISRRKKGAKMTGRTRGRFTLIAPGERSCKRGGETEDDR